MTNREKEQEKQETAGKQATGERQETETESVQASKRGVK